jgi:hypothetical protein
MPLILLWSLASNSFSLAHCCCNMVSKCHWFSFSLVKLSFISLRISSQSPATKGQDLKMWEKGPSNTTCISEAFVFRAWMFQVTLRMWQSRTLVVRASNKVQGVNATFSYVAAVGTWNVWAICAMHLGVWRIVFFFFFVDLSHQDLFTLQCSIIMDRRSFVLAMKHRPGFGTI